MTERSLQYPSIIQRALHSICELRGKKNPKTHLLDRKKHYDITPLTGACVTFLGKLERWWGMGPVRDHASASGKINAQNAAPSCGLFLTCGEKSGLNGLIYIYVQGLNYMHISRTDLNIKHISRNMTKKIA
jgi:hypothetical protein